jgi:hypothetical protein
MIITFFDIKGIVHKEIIPRGFTMTTHRLTLPSSPNSFRLQTKFLLSPTHRTTLIWHPVTSSYFLK